MLEYLKPISGSHSISKVISSVFIPETFLKPQDIFGKIQELKEFISYQKKGLLHNRTININKEKFNITKDVINGFIFESFDERGLVENIFKLENINDKQSILSLENRKYQNWNLFKNKFSDDVKNLSKKIDFYVEAVSLTYIDEFIWDNNEDDIDVKNIFNSESELISKKFLSSINGTLILISQGNSGKFNYEERTEITFNNNVKRIVVNHQYAIKLDEIKLYSQLSEDGNFLSYYDLAHKENKTVLKNVLSQKCQDLINLK